MEPDTSFWEAMTQLLLTNPIIIDRPKGTPHPRYREMIYPLDYGYVENTISSDGGGIDVWIGSLFTVTDNERVKTLTGILCTFDTLKWDAEIKLLIGCSQDDTRIIRDILKDMRTLYIPNPMVDNDLSN
jgi:inorganic pyrophosphatase